MLKITFVEDKIRKNGSIIPRLVQRNNMDFDKLLKLMGLRTGLSESDMRSVFQHFTDTLALFLPEGNLIQTPFGTFSVSLPQRGVTISESTLGTTPSRSVSTNRLAIRLRNDRTLVSRLKAATTVEVVDGPSLLLPVVFQVENTERVNVYQEGSVGEVLHICGNRLSFPKTDVQLGVFFVDSATKYETRVASYSRIGSNFVDCKIPVVPPGVYLLEVRTNPTETEVRVGTLSLPMTVN